MIILARCLFSLLALLATGNVYAQSFSSETLSSPQRGVLIEAPAGAKSKLAKEPEKEPVATDDAVDQLTQA